MTAVLRNVYCEQQAAMPTRYGIALNEMRVNREPLDKSLQDRLSYLYSSTVSTPAELREVLTAVPPDDAWEAYLWLNPESPGDSTVERDFANLTEISGDRAKALAELRRWRSHYARSTSMAELRITRQRQSRAFPGLPNSQFTTQA